MGFDDEFPRPNKVDNAVIQMAHIDLLFVNIVCRENRIELVACGEQIQVAGSPFQPGDMSVRACNFICDTNKRPACSSPRAGWIVFFGEPIVGRECEIKFSAIRRNVRRPKAIFIRAVEGQSGIPYKPTDGLPML